MNISLEQLPNLMPLALFAFYRIAIPIIFARKAMRKGYSYYLFALVGVFISPLCCIIFSCYIPDRSTLGAENGATADGAAPATEQPAEPVAKE